MKINKFNESYNDKNELDNFVELIVEKFFGDYVGNMGSYNCVFIHSLNLIRLYFEFMCIEENELNILQKISKYIKKFDNSSQLILEANMVDKELNVVSADINITTNSYSKIYEDLEMWIDTKNFNL